MNLILEVKSYGPLREVERQGAHRWRDAVNADGSRGRWAYDMADRVEPVDQRIDTAAEVGCVPRPSGIGHPQASNHSTRRELR